MEKIVIIFMIVMIRNKRPNALKKSAIKFVLIKNGYNMPKSLVSFEKIHDLKIQIHEIIL